MPILENLDLLSVGVAVAATVVLGFTVYLNDKKSLTNKTFLYFALVTAAWGILNLLSYRINYIDLAFWFLRGEIALGVWQAFFIFKLFYVFPAVEFNFPKAYRIYLVPLAIFTSFICLTPLVFVGVKSLTPQGYIHTLETGPGILLFGIVSVGLVLLGFLFLLKKIYILEEQGNARFLRFFLYGAVLMFAPLIILNFIFPAFLQNPDFVPFGGLTIFPFVALVSWAILKHKLFNIRVGGTAALVFLLAISVFFEVIFASLAKDLALIIYRSSILVLVLVFGVLLIKGVIREVEQREKLAELNKKLQSAYEEVDRLSKAKSEFISIASHQLRTPLSAIKGYISMIIEGTYGQLSEKAKRPLENVYQSNERLIKLVNDLLSVSRIEAGRVEFEPEETQVEEVVDSVVQELKITAEQKKLYLKLEKPKVPLPKVFLDKDKMRQVLLNLLNNAIKYTKEGGITIKLQTINYKLRTIIQDTGEGMTKEDLAKLFESFSRGTVGTQISAEGAGLGLYIARKFVEMHKGKIWAESEGKNKGSTFYVELPLIINN